MDIKSVLKDHALWLECADKGKRANLSNADLRGVNLSDANLSDANLGYADLRGANLRGANLGYAGLRGANLGDADLGYAGLRGANLGDADLRRANLSDADLRRANLRRADLRRANLRRADLRGANLHGANLYGAYLSGAEGIHRLPVCEPRSYQWIAVAQNDNWIIFAGCRAFTIQEARNHWLSPEYEGPQGVKETVGFALDWIEKQPLP